MVLRYYAKGILEYIRTLKFYVYHTKSEVGRTVV